MDDVRKLGESLLESAESLSVPHPPLHVGERVEYRSHSDAKWEPGVVKSIPADEDSIFVLYDDDSYRAKLTPVSKLRREYTGSVCATCRATTCGQTHIDGVGWQCGDCVQNTYKILKQAAQISRCMECFFGNAERCKCERCQLVRLFKE